jgi:hypothetical protein
VTTTGIYTSGDVDVFSRIHFFLAVDFIKAAGIFKYPLNINDKRRKWADL